MKEPKCSFCKELGHYRINCFQAPRTAIKPSSKPLKKTPLRRPATKTAIYPSMLKKLNTRPVSRRKQLIKDLDTVFSQYIRRTNSINGVARCVTCGKYDSWKSMDCGHFIVRIKIGTRFDERNCNVQCRVCNRQLQGNMKSYTLYMKAKYGIGIVDELKAKSSESLRTYEIEAMLKHYKEKLLKINN